METEEQGGEGRRRRVREGRSVFLFKRAEHLERVEPAAISGRGERGSGGNAIGLAEQILPAQGYLEA